MPYVRPWVLTATSGAALSTLGSLSFRLDGAYLTANINYPLDGMGAYTGTSSSSPWIGKRVIVTSVVIERNAGAATDLRLYDSGGVVRQLVKFPASPGLTLPLVWQLGRIGEQSTGTWWVGIGARVPAATGVEATIYFQSLE